MDPDNLSLDSLEFYSVEEIPPCRCFLCLQLEQLKPVKARKVDFFNIIVILYREDRNILLLLLSQLQQKLKIRWYARCLVYLFKLAFIRFKDNLQEVINSV